MSHESLAELGAVSEEVALQMARGARERLLPGFDDEHSLAVAVTGVAGPGQSESKPAGTVWLAIVGRGGAEARCMHFEGDRDSVRAQTVDTALDMLTERLADR